MLSTSPTTAVRSSLEEMLESLRRRDEKPKDLPPALPSRPTSKARLPSARRSLPANFRVNEEELSNGAKEVKRKTDDPKEERINTFGRKKMKSDQLMEDSPYSGRDPVETAAGVLPVASTSQPAVDRDDNIGHFIKKKLHVWCRPPSGHWESGLIRSVSHEEAFVQLSPGNGVKVSIGDILPANPNRLEGVDDLTQLCYLNEPSVLHNLRHRFLNNKIYSKAGDVLIAVNPCRKMQIIGSNAIRSYREKRTNDPHVYAVANAAYDEMMEAGVNQSIIVSGESGAGKTETAKIAVQYLASLGGDEGDRIGFKILQTSCVLEAFGNAKTMMNDNSSRFGKLIDVKFDTTGKTCGAIIQTFQLEKSRVVQLADGERSYHVFYQLCAGASSVLRDKLSLKRASDYYYLNQSSCLTIDGVDDAEKYYQLMDALDVIQISKEDQDIIISVLAAILWLGNIKFGAVDDKNHVHVVIDEAVTSAAKLMGCSAQDLVQALTTSSTSAANDGIDEKMTLRQAMGARDALAKSFYASLFSWLVDQMNRSLSFGEFHSGPSGRVISILDICGFESFKRNSFEQICINYTNERLLQHFNRHLLKLEQEEYEADGIDWTRVDFEDNQDCLSLFEKRPLGFFSLLDEESSTPNATDLTFSEKFKQQLSSNRCLKAGGSGCFSINHYAGEVLYDTADFLEKNRDLGPSESILDLLSRSSPLLQPFASSMLSQSQEPSHGSLSAAQCSILNTQKQSVGTKLKGEAYRLMQRLESTEPHFICCIKSNHKQLPGVFEVDLAAQQLRGFGVLNLLRIARSGYPSKHTHQEFAQRYGFLLLDRSLPQDPLSISVAVLQRFNIPPQMYQVGYTKLYLRTAQVGGLENIRKQVLQSVVGVQKCFRGYRVRCQHHEVKRGAVVLQSFIRGENTRRLYASLWKKQKASACSQRHKHKRSGSKADEPQEAVIKLQSAIRGALVRKEVNGMQRLAYFNSGGADTGGIQTNGVAEVKVPSSVVMELQRQPVREESKKKGTLGQKEEHSNLLLEDSQDLCLVLGELRTELAKAQATLVQKEEENATLKSELQQHENRWSDYEAKMRKMEDMWQKQIKTLQASLATAKDSLTSGNTSDQAGRHESSPSPSPLYVDSDDNLSPLDRTPGTSTPIKLVDGGRQSNGTSNPVNRLAKEFEQRRQGFDEEVTALHNVRMSGGNPDDELRRLKTRFAVWKKEFKSRIRNTRGLLHKQVQPDGERKSKSWRWFSHRRA